MESPFHPLAAVILACAVTAALAAGTSAQSRYRAERAGDVVRLHDSGSRMSVSIMPSVGNIAFDFAVNGQNVLHWPYLSTDAFRSTPAFSGMPFMGPWANRLDEQAFYANGQKYSFDMALGNVRGAIPIHGFLTFTDQWEVSEVRSDGAAAWVTSTLEFYRHPAWMKQFPFAHTIRMTYRLESGALEVRTRIDNMSREPMPVSIGYHPYFRLTDSSRDDWTTSVGARAHWLLAPNKVPTGETQPISQFFPAPERVALRDFDLDHVFGDLVRDGDGRSLISVKGKSQRLDVLLGAKYRAVVLYSPTASNFISVEPMAGITNAMNLAHRGLYKDLQSIEPGGSWEESFWVRASGF